MPLPPAADEPARLAALHRLNLLDTPAEQAFDDLTRLASAVCGTPIALVSLLDAGRQWFKSRHGLDATETPREWAFCDHAVRQPGLFEVPDAAADERFAANPLVTDDPHIRFYAGVPLTTPCGRAVGTLCVIDRSPRTLTADQRDALAVLGRQVTTQFELRRREGELRESEERFRAFMDHSPALAFVKDDGGRYVYVNAPSCERFGVPQADWRGKTDADLWPADIAAALRETDRRVLAGGETVKVLETVPTPDGGGRFWQSYKFPLTAPDGRRYLAGMAVDVTAEKRAEADLRASEAKFRGTLDRLAEGVYLVDVASGRFVEANAAILALLGYTADEFLALRTPDLVAREVPEVIARTVAAIHRALAADGRCDLGRKHLRRKDGSEVAVDVRVTAVPSGGAGLHAVIVRDMTEQLAHEGQLFAYQEELERANARLKALATTDRLTGVRNRGAFNDKLTEEYDRAVRYAHPLSVVLLDVDHFKGFNDAFGHPAGDAVLVRVAGLLQQTARGTDVVARYGGEEFAVILPDTDRAGAMVLAERCRRAVAAAGWERRAITISVGVSTLAADTPDAAVLVKSADDALYRSKHAGRNRVSHAAGTVTVTPPPKAVLA